MNVMLSIFCSLSLRSHLITHVWSDQMTYRRLEERGIRRHYWSPDHHLCPSSSWTRLQEETRHKRSKKLPCPSFCRLSIRLSFAAQFNRSPWASRCSCSSSEGLNWIPLIIWMWICHFISPSVCCALPPSSLTVHLHTPLSFRPLLPSLPMIVYHLWFSF